MEEVAELLQPFEGEEEIDEDAETLYETAPYWYASAFDREIHHHHLSPLDPPSLRRGSRQIPSDSDSESNYPEDQVSLALDLLDGCSPQPHDGGGGGSDDMEVDPFPEAFYPFGFGVYDEGEETGSDYLELGLGLGLGLGIEKEKDDEDGGVGENMDEGSDWGGDGIFTGRRSVVDSESAGGEPSRLHDGEGLRIVGFGLDSDSEDERIEAMGPDCNNGYGSDQITDDLGLPLCWDCLCIEEDRRESNEEFEWEEVDGRVDEREVLSMVNDADEDRSIVGEEAHVDVELGEEETVRNIEWEVLLAVNNLERNTSIEHEDAESYLGDDHEGYVYTSEYEILFGQFPDHDSSFKGSPPAAKSVVESLPSVVLTQEDVVNNNTLCAVCKDEISLEESAKRLPCSHHYHGECILPWLGIRNTCPVCRYELPTDDPDYESWKARRARSSGAAREARLMNDFEMFP